MFKHVKYMVCVLSLLAGFSLLAQENVAIVTKAQGEVSLKRANLNADSSEVQPGTRIQIGDRLRTGENGYLALVFLDDKSQLKIQSNSEIEILGQINQQAGEINKEIQMNRGQLNAQVAKQRRGKFIIATPTSVASVKGTEFWLQMLSQFDRVLVNEGVVSFLNKISGDSVSVHMGYGANSSRDGSLETFLLVGLRGTIQGYNSGQGQITLSEQEIISQPSDTTLKISDKVWITGQTVIDGKIPAVGSPVSVTGTVRKDGSVEALVVTTGEKLAEESEHELKIEFEDAQGNKKTLEIQFKEK